MIVPVAATDTLVPGRRPQQLRCGLIREARNGQRHADACQLGDVLPGQLVGAVGADQQATHVANGRRDEAQDPDRRRVGPLEIVEHHDERCRRTRRPGRPQRSPRTGRSTPPGRPPATRPRTGRAPPPNRPAGEGSAPTATTVARPPPATPSPTHSGTPARGRGATTSSASRVLPIPGSPLSSSSRAPPVVQVGQASRRHRQLGLAAREAAGQPTSKGRFITGQR